MELESQGLQRRMLWMGGIISLGNDGEQKSGASKAVSHCLSHPHFTTYICSKTCPGSELFTSCPCPLCVLCVFPESFLYHLHVFSVFFPMFSSTSLHPLSWHPRFLMPRESYRSVAWGITFRLCILDMVGNNIWRFQVSRAIQNWAMVHSP